MTIFLAMAQQKILRSPGLTAPYELLLKWYKPMATPWSIWAWLAVTSLKVQQSHRHGGALVGSAPPNKASIPPNWNMKHY